jgi:hypothetical protein
MASVAESARYVRRSIFGGVMPVARRADWYARRLDVAARAKSKQYPDSAGSWVMMRRTHLANCMPIAVARHGKIGAV